MSAFLIVHVEEVLAGAKLVKGWVAQEPFDIAIVAQRLVADPPGQGKWEAVYGIKAGKGQVDLPSCFTLRDDMAEALEVAVLAQGGT